MQYSSTVFGVLFVFWALGSLALAWFVRRWLYVYLGSVALCAPALAYSMVGHGFLEMGGILHVLVAGVYALPFHYLFQRSRARRQIKIPNEKRSH
jgi:hypothetical protein